LPANPAVRFETIAGKSESVLTPPDKLDEPPSLVALRAEVKSRMPRVDLPEILLEIAARTGFAEAFMHLTEHTARASDPTRVYVPCCVPRYVIPDPSRSCVRTLLLYGVTG
jgi:hypothetical protein